MTSTARALVLAHYHSRGALRSDTLALLAAAAERFSRVLLISTRLESAEMAKVPRGVEVRVRANVGYDFYSYRQGLLELLDDPACGTGLGEICLMNSSFLCMDGVRLLERLLDDSPQSGECVGLVKSWEAAEHVQSYVLVLTRRILCDAAVARWWANMRPLTDRGLVIRDYEIGFSQLLLRLGYRLRAIYDQRARITAEISRLSCGPAQSEELNAKLNPSHFHWLSLLREFSTLKIEVYRRNPFGLDLRPLQLMAQGDARVRALLAEGLEN